MPITYKKATQATASPAVARKTSTHAKRRPIDDVCFDPSKPSRLRTGHLMTIYGLSHSGVYKHMKEGRIPKPDGYYGEGARPTPYWLTNNPKIQELVKAAEKA